MSAPVVRQWHADGRSVMGASHVALRIPNQDAIAWTPRARPAASCILAVSDGHGAAAHFRSSIGSHIAVDVALAAVSEAVAETEWIAAGNVARLSALVTDIVARWRAQVRSHVFVRPLAELKTDDPDIYTPYGATLVAAAATPHGILALQIGDGDLVVGCADGTLFRPLPDDEGLEGQQTYSLCQDDAEMRFRGRMLRREEADVDFVMLSTDGLSKSFADESAFLQLADHWRLTIAETGMSTVADRLDAWLSDASRQGSGDDITLGFLMPARSNTPGKRADAPSAGAARARTELLPKPTKRSSRAPFWGFLGGAGAALLAATYFLHGWLR